MADKNINEKLVERPFSW